MRYDDFKAKPGKRLAVFSGPNCPGCIALKPTLTAAAADAGVELGQFMVPQELAAARELGLRQVPTVLLIDNGKASVLFTGNKMRVHVDALLREKGL
jgi:thioredoxin-like negative regulator of GroEL